MDDVERKRICLVLPSLVSGGMERVMSELAIFFSANKHAEVHIILLGIHEKFYSLPPEIIIHEPAFAFNKKRPLLHILRTMWYLRKKIYNINPSTVLSFGEMYNSFVLAATILTPFKIFVSDRSKPDKNWGKFHHLLRFIFYRRANGIIAQTMIAKNIMLRRFAHNNIKVIGNPIKPVNGSNTVERKNIIITAGRLIKSKRINLLIQIFNNSANENWQLHILGDGPEKALLELLVDSLNLRDKVFFHGTQKELVLYYAQSKIFAFTSNSEGFPNVLGEAMSAGLAPITFNFIAGASDLIQDNNNGFLIPMDDESLYIKKLNALMDNDVLVTRIANQAKESIRKFDSEIIANEYYNFILS